MHCIYCGTEINIDDVDRCQRVGFDTENDSGTIVETQRLISTAKCDQCGSQTSTELQYNSDLLELESGTYVRSDGY